MIAAFGQNPATVPALLQFLTLLPEELNTNTRIPITVRLSSFSSVIYIIDEINLPRTTNIGKER
jgi:hypothetical protein